MSRSNGNLSGSNLPSSAAMARERAGGSSSGQSVAAPTSSSSSAASASVRASASSAQLASLLSFLEKTEEKTDADGRESFVRGSRSFGTTPLAAPPTAASAVSSTPLRSSSSSASSSSSSHTRSATATATMLSPRSSSSASTTAITANSSPFSPRSSAATANTAGAAGSPARPQLRSLSIGAAPAFSPAPSSPSPYSARFSSPSPSPSPSHANSSNTNRFPAPASSVAASPRAAALPSSSSTSFSRSASHSSSAGNNATTSGSGGGSGGGLEALKAKMGALKSDHAAKDALVASLRSQIAELEGRAQTSTTRHAEALASQKAEYESLLSSSQSFVEKVLGEKKELNAQVDSLGLKIEQLSRDFAAQQHSWRTTVLPAEIQKAKELWLQAERVARESFLSHRAKQIKAETLASLEPEVQRALARERAERKENEELLARRHVQALQDQRHDHESLIASIRKQHLTALEHAREEERVAAQRRAREIVERYDAQMQEMRSRHTAELEAERDRATKTSSSLQNAIDAATMQARQDALVSAAKAAEAARQEQDDLVRRHALALAQEREKQSIERESWQSLMLAKLSREAEARLAAAKKEADRAHEEEISMLVARLGADAEKQVKDVVRDSERKIDALKRATQADIAASKTKADEASKHLATLKKEHAALEERVRTTEARLASVVAELSAKSSTLREAEARIAQLDSSLTNARRDVSDTFASEKAQLRSQFRAMQSKLDEQARLLAAAEEQGRQALQHSLAQRDDSHARAAEGMQARVKELLAKKEGVIEALQRRVQDAEAEVQRVHQELHHLG